MNFFPCSVYGTFRINEISGNEITKEGDSPVIIILLLGLIRPNNYGIIFIIKIKESKMEDNLSELGEPSSKAKYESLSDSE